MQGDNDGPLDAFGRAFGARVDGASPRGFLRFLSLTAFQAEGCGIAMGPQSGPGSEGSEGSACLWQAGSEGGGLPLCGAQRTHFEGALATRKM